MNGHVVACKGKTFTSKCVIAYVHTLAYVCVCVCIRLSLNHSLNSVRYLRLIIQRKVHKCLSTICTESTSVNVYVHNYAQAKHAHIHEQYVNTQINTNTHKYLLIYILLHQYA